MTDKQKDLDKYRNEIDEIDDEIHQLLLNRTTLAHKISEAKGNSKGTNTGLAIRPSREAFILRRLKKNHHGDFPFASLARMWREMINAFTLLQSHYELAVYTKSNDMRCWEVARDQFGSIVKMHAFDTPEKAVQHAEENNHIIAIVPQNGLFYTHNTNVILRLPFSGECHSMHTHYDVYAIAQLSSQNSGNDTTIFREINSVTPSDAEEIIRNGDTVIYTKKGFDTNGIGVYPNGIEETHG